MNPITRPVLRYHGGKFGTRGAVADRIAAEFPEHRIYVEPFGGAASVLLRKPRSYGEIYNDQWSGVVTVFRVLRDPEKSAQLIDLLRLTPFARDEIDNTYETHMRDLSDIEYARRLIFRSFAGFGSGAMNPKYATGFRASCKRSGTTPARDWMNYPPIIEAFVARLQGVVIENVPAADVIPRHDSPETLFYVDPPYVHSTRSQKRRRVREYEFEMTDTDHCLLAAQLRNVAGMVVLSGYPCELYDDLYRGWERLEFAAMADGASPRTEVLWFNAAAALRRRDMRGAA